MSIKSRLERLERGRRRDRELDQAIEHELDELADKVRSGALTLDQVLDGMVPEFAEVTRAELRLRLI